MRLGSGWFLGVLRIRLRMRRNPDAVRGVSLSGLPRCPHKPAPHGGGGLATAKVSGRRAAPGDRLVHAGDGAILSAMGDPRQPFGDEPDVVTETRTQRKLKKPKMYKVLLHNDDYTTMEFVVFILQHIFHRAETDAVQIMLHVHKQGLGVAGVYTYEIAETRVRQVEALAREHEFPLRCSMEEA